MNTKRNFLAFAALVSPILAASTGIARAGTYQPVDISAEANFSWVTHIETDPNGQTGVYLPDGPLGMVTLGGIPFDIASNANDYQAWNAWTAASGGSADQSVTVPIGAYGVTNVYTLINTYFTGFSDASGALASLTFSGSGGATYTDSLISNVDITDWCCTGTINGTTTTEIYSATSHFDGDSVPAHLDMQNIALPAAFADQTLISMTLVDTGGPQIQRTILDGVTVEAAAVPEPAGWALMLIGIGGLGAALRLRPRPASPQAAFR